MALLRPFRALRPDPRSADQVASVPYDVVNSDEAAVLAQGNPLSFLRVSRPEIEMPAGTDPHAPAVYEKARANFHRLIQSVPLVRENEPSLYVYRLQMGDRIQTGIAASFSIDEYDQDLIKKHEKTRQDKEDDRTKHVLSLGAQSGPVFLAYRGQSQIDAIVESETRRSPLFDFSAPDSVRHTVWKVSDPKPLVDRFRSVSALYIADGHHRAASASRARTELKRKNPSHNGDEDYNFVLAVAFPAEQLKILPYYRALKDWNGMTPESLMSKLETAFTIQADASADPRRGEFAMYLEQRWYGLKPKSAPNASGSAIARLDVSVLQDRVLSPLFGIRDPRTDQRIEFVGGIRGTKELERLVNTGKACVAFSLHPTTLEDLMEISDAHEIMPPKSTWFEPKLRDGLLTHVIHTD